jgi:photosystem II stability/assembly factor-like uncharacterized protein
MRAIKLAPVAVAASLLLAACRSETLGPTDRGPVGGSANHAAEPADPTRDVPYDLMAVDFTDPAHGWIVGNDPDQNVSVILRTSNGGLTWERLLEMGDESLVDVDFVDEHTGWAVGIEGQIYQTTDGGESWKVDAPTAWAVQRDSGARVVKEGSAVLLSESIATLFFVDSKVGWAAGEAPTGNGLEFRGLLLGTVDGGRTWTELKDSEGQSIPFVITDLWFTDQRAGWAAGGDIEKGEEDVILHTTDGGRSWQRQTTGVPQYHRAVQFVDDRRGYLVGMTLDVVDDVPGPSKILVTEDGGQTWTVAFTAERSFYDVHFVDAQRGWVVGERASIYFTVDGGQTWRQQSRFATKGSKKVGRPATYRPKPKTDAVPGTPEYDAAMELPSLRALYFGKGGGWAAGDRLVLKRK